MRLLVIFIGLLYLSGCSQLRTYTQSEQVDVVIDDTIKQPEPATAKEPEHAEKAYKETPPQTYTAPEKSETQGADSVHIDNVPPPPEQEPLTAPSPHINDVNTSDISPLFTPRNVLDETIDLRQEGVIDVLDLPFDPLENALSSRSKKGQDFSEYGFVTPDDQLETLLNQEIDTLRTTGKKKPQENDLLDRIRSGFQLDLELDNKRIQYELDWYTRNPNYLTRTFNRSARYLYHVVNEVEERGLPLELALLPFVESAYNPFAYSHGRASGLWQFIPGTAKMYGMHQDWWYDGRRDVLASTEGALNYLSYLNEVFDGNWLHALASYNSGSGRVSSAIKKNQRRNKPTDFWSLNLPKETRAYVPKLLALAKIVQSPEAYNIEFPMIENTPYFEKVDIGGQLDLAQAAKLADVDISEIYQLNPGFNQWASSPLGPHHLLVPVEKADLFKENLTSLPPEKRLNWHRYTVKSGDSLIKIAKKFNTTPMLIKDVNHLKSNTIRTRQKLLIPIASKSTQFYDLSETNRLQKKQDDIQARKNTSKIDYRVKKGDTIWDLSRKHKVGIRELARWNGLAPGDPIYPGQKLVIWSKQAETLATPQLNIPAYQKREMIQKVGYYVRKGDSLAKIANKFSVSIKDLIAWNKLDAKKYLKPGQKLTIYVDITNS